MRVCRFLSDDLLLAGFYRDDVIIPLSQACESYCAANDLELLLPATEDLLDLLPPDGMAFSAAQELSRWLETLDDERISELSIPVDEVVLLTPIAEPRKILLLAGNYSAHVAERGGTTAERSETFPYVFMKPPSTTLINPGDAILLPEVSPDHIDWECELGVVIGRTCRHVPEEEAFEYIAGYTVLNDVSDRKFTPNPGRKTRERDKFFDWMHGKWHDTFCPVGPCILSADMVADPQVLKLNLRVNGQIKQDASTEQMVFPVAAIVSFLSQFVTLEPGDLIATGTPAGVGSASGTYLRSGDLVEATVEGIGTLTNPVMTEAEALAQQAQAETGD